ncbi:PKD domain-containing protein [Sorangium sp. So ce590]|uniref:PKD domain-containing protein n=1 Tax=Sorangium sp. So ce590 TaxID=3133317 RepID=UPI003F619918
MQSTITIALALASHACDMEKSDGDAAGTTGAIHAALAVRGARHDVTAIHYKVVGAGSTCGDAPLAEATSALEPEALPGSVLPASSGTHAGDSVVFLLPPGNYRVCATPMSDAAPSSECAPTEGTAYVAAEATTEVLLVSQCGGGANGGLDTVVALNDPPRINDLDIAPSKFISRCETATITVGAEDPDGDPISFAWSITASPSGSSPALQATGAASSFSTDMPGDYQVQVTVSDVYAASSSLTFPVHVSAEDCSCTCPEGFTQLPDGDCATSYDIDDASVLINQDMDCDGLGLHRRDGCNSMPYGFRWTDAGGALGPVQRLDVELENGLTCYPGSRSVSLNGTTIGSFDTIGTCSCDPVHGLISLPDVGFGTYNQGDYNAVLIHGPSCEGLSRSDALGGAFARVTVTYSCEGGAG